MRMERIAEEEEPERFAARLGAPLCAVLRANRLTNPAWLAPGQAARVPEPGFCAREAFPCPARLFDAPARERPAEAFAAEPGDTLASVARALGTSERLILLALGRRSGPLREGERFLLDRDQTGARPRAVLPGERLEDLTRDPAEAARINRLEGAKLYPGTRVVLPEGKDRPAARRE